MAWANTPVSSAFASCKRPSLIVCGTSPVEAGAKNAVAAPKIDAVTTNIQGSIAHAKMLGQQHILTEQEVIAIVHGLENILLAWNKGEFKLDVANEDVHMNVESRLRELIGPAAGRLHPARSRNDQVATDFRLWVRDALDGLD